MSIFTKAKCKVGLHGGKWSELDSECIRTRCCPICGKLSSRAEHNWSEFTYIGPGSCEQRRECQRCAAESQRTSHMWGPPVYTRAGDCSQMRSCNRCRDTQSLVVPVHSFTEWRYSGPNSCDQLQCCSRCGSRGPSTRLLHQWSGYQFSERAGRPVRYCTRCGGMG